MDFEQILKDAHTAATKAILEKFRKGDREQPFNCGFAWVKVDGNDPLARFCRQRIKNTHTQLGGRTREEHRLFGDKGEPGWQWWKPGNWPSAAVLGLNDVPKVYEQDMDFHIEGAKAFVKVLAEHGIRATVGSRLD